MSRDTLVKLSILLGTLATGLLMMLWNGLTFPIAESIAPLGVAGVLTPAAVFYHRKQTEEFVSTLLATIFMMVYLSCFTIFMYAGTAMQAPFVDSFLVQSDAFLGASLPGIVQWAKAHPTMTYYLKLAYHSGNVQTLLIVLFLGLKGEKRPLERFVFQFMFALFVIGIIFTFAPAEGPFVAYGYKPTAQQITYLQHLDGFRSGEMTLISLKNAEGLVTFPSFHTTWAILLAAAVWHRKKLFVPVLLLNLCVIAATLTTGWHYMTDVLGGAILAFFVIWLSYRIEPWLKRKPETE
ncbi:hypothetical protein MNBD_PLANCTO02-232 [hydrothermal vent metagenome]|uniref:Inositolphosphotransferase Aur1/Ipt1 domain-containing protein n=1 Tax=hydrothermal vent metagenome TaxID=652676 RepID=A0A3B1D8S7_9ZZZZ